MITAHNLSKHFGRVKAVDDISFQVDEGETLVLLGTSGCGKTTTLKMVNRLVEPSAGKVTVNGTDIMRQRPEILRRSIGYVLQHNSFFPHYTVSENIAVVPRLLNWDTKKIHARTEELLHKLHLPAHKYSNVYPHQLSGGQQQRVNIARALAADPPILLMDEPFGALDTITRNKISHEFSEIAEFMNKTIVLVTHDVQEAFLLGDRIALMSEGKIVQEGKPLELLFAPVNDFVRDFFASSYLRLALGAITVDDVWGNLADEGVAGKSIDAPHNQSLWTIIESAVKNNSSRISVRNARGEIKNVSKEAFLTAFGQYKYN